MKQAGLDWAGQGGLWLPELEAISHQPEGHERVNANQSSVRALNKEDASIFYLRKVDGLRRVDNRNTAMTDW